MTLYCVPAQQPYFRIPKTGRMLTLFVLGMTIADVRVYAK